MKAKVLVVYGSRCGGTAEIAQCIGEAVTDWGGEAVVCPVREAPGAEAFDAAIIGGAARFGRLLPEVVAYARKQAVVLSWLPTAYFLSAMTLREDSPENRRQAESYLRPLIEVHEPVSLGLFGGIVDYGRLPRLLGFMLAHDRAHSLPEGDYRDWAQIREWAAGLAEGMLVEDG